MAGTYPRKNLIVTDDIKISIFFKRKLFNSIIIFLFSLILTSTTLAQSTSSVSCNQTTTNQFQDSLTAYAKTIKKKNA